MLLFPAHLKSTRILLRAPKNIVGCRHSVCCVQWAAGPVQVGSSYMGLSDEPRDLWEIRECKSSSSGVTEPRVGEWEP